MHRLRIQSSVKIQSLNGYCRSKTKLAWTHSETQICNYTQSPGGLAPRQNPRGAHWRNVAVVVVVVRPLGRSVVVVIVLDRWCRRSCRRRRRHVCLCRRHFRRRRLVGRSVRRRHSRRRDRASSLTSFFVTRLSSTAPRWNRNVGIPPFKDREHCLWPLVPRGCQEAPLLRALNGGFPTLRLHRGEIRNGERQPATIASETNK